MGKKENKGTMKKGYPEKKGEIEKTAIMRRGCRKKKKKEGKVK